MKRVFITGGRGDIGSSVKEIFKSNGYEVIAPSSIELNLEKIRDIKEYFKDKDLNFDIFVHCAGVNNPEKIENLTAENIEKTLKVNYLSFFELAKILSDNMKKNKKGKIVAISSLYGSVARSGRLAYTTSKFALNGCVKSLCQELGKYNIQVNSVSPGFVDTKMTRKNNTSEKINSICAKIPMKRLANTNEIAKVVYFLCSDDNSYISGQDIIVDGGYMSGAGQEE